VLEVAGADAQIELAPGDPRHRGDAVGHVDGMTERDDRRGAQPDAFGDAGEVGQGHERLDERPVGAFHAMRVEHEVVANPQRIEPEPVGEPGTLDEQILVGLDPEVRDEQAEARSHGQGLLTLRSTR
jgi:hypothetical protein